MSLDRLWKSLGWECVHRRRLPGRQGEYRDLADLPLAAPTRAALEHLPRGLYAHQHRALQAFAAGEDVCLATGTASGKSLVFYAAGIETLVREPGARVLAFYPLKALAREQEQRWREALAAAGLPLEVGRVDGHVPAHERSALLRRCAVLIVTPDVVHAWLLSNLAARDVRQFLARVRLVVVDEVHVYTGVFGSNAAFLFRRLMHAVDVLGGGAPLRWVAASATIADPEAHLAALCARPFRVIGPAEDASPRHPLTVHLVQPPPGADLNTSVTRLLDALAQQRGARFLAFVDSRKQTERLAAIIKRAGGRHDDELAEVDPVRLDLRVAPYRAGYEDEDRRRIQERLAAGELAGVISTSAMELGIDLPGLTTVVLVGVPGSATSLQQRIGRVGRHGPGDVVIVHAGGVYDELVFQDPDRLFRRPLAQAGLYLQNRRVQYIHALCFASPGGEYDALRGNPPGEAPDAPIATRVPWPEGFLELCARERTGQIPQDLVGMKVAAGDSPWHAYPLRDVDVQFSVECRHPDLHPVGSLSHSQVIREAYPGAVYYYLTTPYRVTRILFQQRKILVRRERHYTTDPLVRPTTIFPQLDDDRAYRIVRYGPLRVVECTLYVTETVYGYRERRGSVEEEVRYPCPFYPSKDRFSRNFVTTGVLLSHPALERPEVQRELLARLVLEGFLLAVPFERGDLAAGEGRFHVRAGWMTAQRFVAVYDQAYGSLRLSGRLVDADVLRAALAEARRAATADLDDVERPQRVTLRALDELAGAAAEEPEEVVAPPQAGTATGAGRPVVIAPGSVGWIAVERNQEFAVEAVFLHPDRGLCYRGRRPGEDPTVTCTFPVDAVLPVPGLSRLGIYDFDSGTVVPLDGEAGG